MCGHFIALLLLIFLISFSHMIQEFLDLNSEPVKLQKNAETDGDTAGHMQTSISPECNGSVLPNGLPCSGSVLPHGIPSSGTDQPHGLPSSGSVLLHDLPSRGDAMLSVSHLSASWTDVSGCCELCTLI